VIASSPNPGFDPSAREWILKALFRPARLHGRAVRVHITQPLDYSIT
jgi:outer membrane biosynthesis protein TonB